jgi:Bacterial extracellular solute-binding proteins, family 5 Middle
VRGRKQELATSKWAATVAFVALAIFFSVSGAGAEQSPSRVAMTMADIPLTDGAPDQGTEGIRFLGYTVYGPLVRWDLSRADSPAELALGLASGWKQDAEDPTRWIFELRQGVRFHDGSSFNTDAVIWNLDRALNEKAPQFDRTARALTISSLWPIVAYRKLDDWFPACTAPLPRAIARVPRSPYRRSAHRCRQNNRAPRHRLNRDRAAHAPTIDNTMATSSLVQASGPTWSCEKQFGYTPRRLTRP